MCIVYNASARATPESPLLNKYLYSGPPLQNKLWDILVRQRAYPIAITADIQKAFLQIRIRECEQNDALRFHWRKSEHEKLEILCFTHTLFGLALPAWWHNRSPFRCFGRTRTRDSGQALTQLVCRGSP